MSLISSKYSFKVKILRDDHDVAAVYNIAPYGLTDSIEISDLDVLIK